MADPDHLKMLQQGVDAWNAWREGNHDITPDLREANLSGMNLRKVDLSGANLTVANLGAADLFKTKLSRANLSGANLSGANLSGADLSGADLQRTSLVDADITGADLTRCRIHGVSAWGLKLSDENQTTRFDYHKGGEPEITVDDIEQHNSFTCCCTTKKSAT